VGLGLGLSVSPLLTQSLTHVPAARAADASGLLTTTVQLSQLLGVVIIGSVYLSRATRQGGETGAMSVTACWLAALSAAGLLAAAVMTRALLVPLASGASESASSRSASPARLRRL
jgi:hypothetical protein